jgi:hypothetical protein
MNDVDFGKLLMNMFIPDYENFDELTRIIEKYKTDTGLAAAICATVHTWCEKHGVDPVHFFDQMFTVVSQQVAEERENGLL